MTLAVEGELAAKFIGVRALKQLGRSRVLAREEEEFLYEVGAAVQDLVIDTVSLDAETKKTRRLWRRG